MEVSTAEQEREKIPELSMQKKIPPESALYTPEKDMVSPRIKYDTVVVGRAAVTPIDSVWQYRTNSQSQIVGFEFSNRGGNPILPHRYEIHKNLLFARDFQFRFDDRARQDIHLFISDWAPSRDKQFRLSELMNSVMHLFPRNYLPAIESSAGRTIVTLPTGEVVEFDAKTHEIVAGVFSEAPVDLNPDKTARKFPAINYIGKGVQTLEARTRDSGPWRRSLPDRRFRTAQRARAAISARYHRKNSGNKRARAASNFLRTWSLIGTCCHAAALDYLKKSFRFQEFAKPLRMGHRFCNRIG